MKRPLNILIAAVAVILLFTACQQFLEDPEDFLSYWASEAFVKDHSIGSAHRPDGAGVPCVASSASVYITLSVHNPKGFSFVMPASSAPAGIVEFKELPSQPTAETDYALERTGSGALKLTYKPSLLQKYEQGSGSLNPTITLKAKDGRVFKQTYTFGIKSNTPPPAPKDIVIAKTNTSPSKYVLCLKFDSDEMRRKIGNTDKPVHNDIANITIKKDSSNNGSSYDLSYKGDNLDFQKPAGTTQIGSFIEHGDVAKLTEDIPPEQETWVLYFKTEVPVESANSQTSYTITLRDEGGVVSDSVTQDLEKKFKVEFDANGGSPAPKTQYIKNGGKVTEPSPQPTKAGHTLDGWFTAPTEGSTQWVFATNKVTEDMTLYAKWTPVTNAQYAVKHYKEKLDGTYPDTAQDTDTGLTGATGATLSVGNGITLKNYPGFEFDKLEPDFPTIAVDGSTVVKVYYKRKQITVTFKPNGGNIGGNTGTVTKTGKYGAPLTAPTATKSGNTFSGWNPTPPAPALPSTFPAVNAEYTAQWAPNTYYVRFNGNGNTDGSMSDQTFTYGQSQQLSANGFIKTGHTFDGWATSAGGSKVYDNQQSVSNLTNVQNGTVNLYAVWKIKTYTVTFSVAAGEGKLQGTYGTQNQTAQNGSGTKTLNSVPHGSSVSFTATADEGWEVEGWTVSSGSFATGGGSGAANATATLTVDGPKTVTVKFKPGELHFNSGGPNAWKRLKEEVEKKKGAHTIVINGEITATNDQGNNGKISIRRELIIKSSGSSASLNANNLSGIFDVNNKLTLENITLKNGREPGNRTGAGAYVNSTLIMKGSSAITNCSAHKGGGVYVNNGTLIMQDSSTISSCTATDKGSGVYVAGTFEMKGNARVNTNNDVYLESGKSITVTGSLSHHPAARITPNSYTNGRVLATGAAEKANFKVTPQDGNKYWRFKKQGGEVKFVPAKLKVTFNKIKCVEVEDASSEAEYYWTMKVGKYVIAERPSNSVWDAKKGHIYEFIENGEYNKYFNWDFSYFPISEIPDINTTPKNYIPVYINIMEYDKSDPDDHIGTTKAHLTYDYDNDEWNWAYDDNWISGPANELHGNQKKNSSKTIGDGGEEIFTEEYRTNDGDTDLTITISWKE